MTRPRLQYDDRLSTPWLVVYGEGKVWGAYYSRQDAERELVRLLDVLLVVLEGIR